MMEGNNYNRRPTKEEEALRVAAKEAMTAGPTGALLRECAAKEQWNNASAVKQTNDPKSTEAASSTHDQSIKSAKRKTAPDSPPPALPKRKRMTTDYPMRMLDGHNNHNQAGMLTVGRGESVRMSRYSYVINADSDEDFDEEYAST